MIKFWFGLLVGMYLGLEVYESLEYGRMKMSKLINKIERPIDE